jgi:hypothetical protein
MGVQVPFTVQPMNNAKSIVPMSITIPVSSQLTFDSNNANSFAIGLLGASFSSRTECRQVWRCLDEGQPHAALPFSLEPLDLLELVQSETNRCALELFLQCCGWFDSRLFSEQQWASYRTLFGDDARKRKDVCSGLTSTLESLAAAKKPATTSTKSNKNRKGKHQKQQRDASAPPVQNDTLDATTAADMLLRVFAGRLVQLAQKSYTCFLVQLLFQSCSESKKWCMAQEVLPWLGHLAMHERGNYLVTLVLKFVRNKCMIVNHPCAKQMWQDVCDTFLADKELFRALAKNRFGSFVLKNFVEWSSLVVKQRVLFLLSRWQLYEELAMDSHGRFVISKLQHGMSAVQR